MVRFYLEGGKPLQDQQWPACLEGRKEEILAATMKDLSIGTPC
jgi:hypothetical protein